MKMAINIGNNNKITNSTIGNSNNKKKEGNKLNKLVIELLITVVGGLIVAYCIYKFGWN